MQIQKYVYILLLPVPSTSFKDLNLPSTPIISKIFVRNIHSIAFQQLNFLNEKYLSTFIIKNVTIIKCNKLSIRCYLLSLSLSPQPKLLSFTQKVFRSFFSPPFSVWKFVWSLLKSSTIIMGHYEWFCIIFGNNISFWLNAFRMHIEKTMLIIECDIV